MTRKIIDEVTAGQRDGALVVDQLVRVTARRWEVVRDLCGGAARTTERYDSEAAARAAFALRSRTSRRAGGRPARAGAASASSVTLRATAAERAAWQAAADHAGVTLADWLRAAYARGRYRALPRGPAAEQRIVLRATAEERATWQWAADRAGVTLAAWLRAVAAAAK